MDITTFRDLLVQEKYSHIEASEIMGKKSCIFYIETNVKGKVLIIEWNRDNKYQSLDFAKLYITHTDSYENMAASLLESAIIANQFDRITPFQGTKVFVLPDK